jgi:hypothetical protein
LDCWLKLNILKGVAQGDDLQYIFSDLWGEDFPMSPNDILFSKEVFLPLLVNFAKTRYQAIFLFFMRIITFHLFYFEYAMWLYRSSVPSLDTPQNTKSNISWKPLTPDNKSHFLRINSNLTIGNDYRTDATRFWNEEIPALFTVPKKAAIHLHKDEL